MIFSKVNNQSISISYDEVVSDSVKYLKIGFDFSDEWDGYVKTAIFRNEQQNITNSVLMVAGEPLYLGECVCLVPHEVIKAPEFTVSVCGVKDDSVITAEEKKILVKESGYRQGEIPIEPTQSEYERIAQIAAQAQGVAASVREDADNGVFKGEKGDKGDKGDDGDINNLDMHYNPTSDNAQSGKAVAEAINSAIGNINTLLSQLVEVE